MVQYIAESDGYTARHGTIAPLKPATTDPLISQSGAGVPAQLIEIPVPGRGVGLVRDPFDTTRPASLDPSRFNTPEGLMVCQTCVEMVAPRQGINPS